MTNYFVDGDEATVVADYPLHAGIMWDLINQNLTRCQEQSGFDITGYHHEDQNSGITHTFSDSDTWEVVTEWACLVLPLRKKQGDSVYRDVTVYADVSSVSGTATFRFYLSNAPAPSSVDGTTPFPGNTEYAELTASSSSLVNDSDTITPATAVSRTFEGTGVSFPLIYVVLIATSTSGDDATVVAPRFVESTT